QYDKTLVFQTLSAGADRWREEFISLFQEIFDPEAIVERNDPPVRDLEGLTRQKGIVFGSLPSPLIIEENGCEFLVDPLEGQKTGIFLDQADNHGVAARYAHGRVMDLFS